MEIVFQEMLRSIFSVFLKPWGPFSDFLDLENKFENETIFREKPDLNKWIWWRILCRYLGPIKT